MTDFTGMTEAEKLEEVMKLFVSATPPVGAPIDAWRTGFEAMAETFPVPEDAQIEEVDSDGVPGKIVIAPGASRAKLIIHFHSGGYVYGSSTAYREFAYRLSAVSGAAVLVPDYRLAPENMYPAAAEDGLRVYRWALKSWQPGEIVISGDSAGGGLAMSTLLQIRDGGLPAPAAGLGISPLLDLAGEGESQITNHGIDPLINRDMTVDMGKVYIGDIDPHEHPYCSPVWGEKHDLPPILLTVSDTEVLRDDSVRFVDGVNAAGGDARAELAAGMVHIWTFFPMLEQATKTMDMIGAFLRKHLG